VGDPIVDPTNKNLPTGVGARPFWVKPGATMNTFRLMHDPPRPTNPFVGSDSYYAQNEVAYFVNGVDSFQAMADAIGKATGDTHFVYFSNWFTEFEVPMGGSTLGDLLSASARGGAQVRALLWRNTVMSGVPWYRLSVDVVPGPIVTLHGTLMPWTWDAGQTTWVPPVGGAGVGVRDVKGIYISAMYDSIVQGAIPGLSVQGVPPYHNQVEVDKIKHLTANKADGTPQAAGFCTAILDSNVPFGAAHHQKVLVTRGSDGVNAFVGGVDFNRDRLSMLYDVHCRVRGPGAGGLASVFNERWDNHPQRAQADASQAHVGDSPVMVPAIADGISDVQIARTYADASKTPTSAAGTGFTHDLVDRIRTMDPFFKGTPYPFAASGATEVWNLYKTAIPSLNHVTLLLQGSSDIDDDGGIARTKKCLDILRSADPDKKKFRAFVRVPSQGATHHYVHSKLMIVDDQYAVIGTANGARRSFDFDSEVAIGVFDRIPKDKTIASFARRLRMRLWSENLDGNTGQDFLNLADGRAAAFWWDAIATVGMGNASGQGWKLYTWEQYLSTASAGTPCADWEWDQIRDPIPPGPT
jgi:hypothetical protein